jgi:hypothetical protein
MPQGLKQFTLQSNLLDLAVAMERVQSTDGLGGVA